MDLPPGRELDALVAEKVMGYRREKAPPDANGENGGTDVLVPPDYEVASWAYPPLGGIALTYFVPRFSTDLTAAWRIVNKLTTTTKQWFRINVFSTGCTATFEVIGAGDRDFEVSAESFEVPHAICLAALKAAEKVNGGA